MKLGEKLQQLVLAGKMRKQFEPSKNALRRAHYTATADVEEEHVSLPKWCHIRLRHVGTKGYANARKYYDDVYGIKRKVVVKRGRFLIGQYLDRSKYNGDGSLKAPKKDE